MNSSFLRTFSTIALLMISLPATATTIGEMAPDFEITKDNGQTFRLSDYRGEKPVYVVFWNTWCSYCIKKTPRYKRLQQQFGDKIEIVAINTTWSDTREAMRSFKEQHDLEYSMAFDTDALVTDRYGVFNVPTEFIVDINGVVRYRDRVPEYMAAHLPDWLLPYVPSKKVAAGVCTP